MPKLKRVRYKVTDLFGDREIGDILPAYVLFRDENREDVALLYHPSTRGECASLEIGIKGEHGIYTSLPVGGSFNEHFINLASTAERSLKGLIKA